MGQKVKLGRVTTRMPKRDSLFSSANTAHYVSGAGGATSQVGLASSVKLAVGFGGGAGVLSSFGGGGSLRGWAGRKGESGDGCGVQV